MNQMLLHTKFGSLTTVIPFLSFIYPSVAGSDIFNVTTTLDGPPGSLRDAIIQANGNLVDNTIILPAGEYKIERSTEPAKIML